MRATMIEAFDAITGTAHTFSGAQERRGVLMFRWRRGWDSNPRTPVEMLLEFQSSAFDRSATSPIKHLRRRSQKAAPCGSPRRSKKGANDNACADGPHPLCTGAVTFRPPGCGPAARP